MMNNNSSKRQTSKSTNQTATTRTSRSKSTTGSLQQTKGKTQSQEDLTKSKEKATTSNRAKTGNVTSRRMTSANCGGDAKTKVTSSNTSNSKMTSSQSRKNTSSTRKFESDQQRSAMENQIKDLENQSKNKDSQIKTLKQQLDKMMNLLDEKNKEEKNNDEKNNEEEIKKVEIKEEEENRNEGNFTSLVKLASSNDDDDNDVIPSSHHHDDVTIQNTSLASLQEENEKLKEKIAALEILQKDHEDFARKEEMTQSYVDDVIIRSSTSVSRSTSTENLLIENEQDIMMSSGRNEEKSSGVVACLHERIHQMQESHISTNEELEATVQELNDLQKSIPELTIDNEMLKQEQKNLIQQLKSCEEKLKDKINEADHLRALVSDQINEADDRNHNELKQQYLRLLNDRRNLIEVQQSLKVEVKREEEEKNKLQNIVDDVMNKMRILEREIKQATNDKIISEKKLKDFKEQSSEENANEIMRLKEELKSEQKRNKLNDDVIKQLSQDDVINQQDFLTLLDNLRRDKQVIETKCNQLDDEVNFLRTENDKLDARVAHLEEDLEANIAKAKKDSSELSELIDHLNDEIRMKDSKLDEANETIFIMEDSVEQQIAVQKHERHTIQQLQNQISNLKEERVRLVKEIQQWKKEERNRSEEWKQFQIDMQMAVSIANDMRTETQAEVGKLREEKQILEDLVTKLRVENEQVRRKRSVASQAITSQPITSQVNEARRNHDSLIESPVKCRNSSNRNSQSSPGVKKLIKSFDNKKQQQQTETTTEVKKQATIAPMQRHNSISSSSYQQNKTNSSNNNSKQQENTRTASSEQLTMEFLRRNSSSTSSVASCSDVRVVTSSCEAQHEVKQRVTSTPTNTSSAARDPLVVLARKYGGSKRNALLQWCQQKTKDYEECEITNFSTSWSDGLALCALLHSYMPAHIPYNSLQQAYSQTTIHKHKKSLQAKHFRLALAAAESVGIEPTLSVDIMTSQERPDWQQVMFYVTQLYKYFET